MATLGLHRLIVIEQFIADRWPGAPEHTAPRGHRRAGPLGEEMVNRIAQP